MTKKIVKKKKLKILPFLIVLFFFGGLFFCLYQLIQLPIRNIVVKNIKYLDDDYIIHIAGIENYPNFFFTNLKKMEKKLEQSVYIEKATVSKKFFHVIVLDVKENKPIFLNVNSNEFVFVDNNKVSLESCPFIFRVPRLMNYVPDDKYESFVKCMGNIQPDVLGKISNIEYQPNDLDPDRFLFYMDDGNMVYLTLTKFDTIHYYNDVLEQLEGRKGILYLDSGNHFQIRE